MDYFNVEGEIEIKELKSIFFYKDLWNKGYRRTDVYKHINGCRNADINIIAEYYDAFKSIDMMKITSNDKNKLKNDWFKDHIGSFPYYYTSPTSREFISLDGTYQIHLHMDRMLYEQLNNSQYNNNVGYLGTNEGWVDVNLRKI
jgi:CRISPR-associated protein Cas5